MLASILTKLNIPPNKSHKSTATSQEIKQTQLNAFHSLNTPEPLLVLINQMKHYSINLLEHYKVSHNTNNCQHSLPRYETFQGLGQKAKVVAWSTRPFYWVIALILAAEMEKAYKIAPAKLRA